MIAHHDERIRAPRRKHRTYIQIKNLLTLKTKPLRPNLKDTLHLRILSAPSSVKHSVTPISACPSTLPVTGINSYTTQTDEEMNTLKTLTETTSPYAYTPKEEIQSKKQASP